MRQSGGSGWLGRAAGALAVATLLGMASLTVPAAALGAGTVDFDPPAAETSRQMGIRWTQRFRSATEPERVELMTRLVGEDAWLVTDVPFDPLERAGRYAAAFTGPTTYVPNSRIEYRFRVTPRGGQPETGPAGVIKVEDERIDWRTLRGDLVRLHWQAGNEAFARRALRIAEDSVAETADLLGVSERLPIDFFLYADAEDFRTALGPGTQEFIAGRAIPEIRTLFGHIREEQIGSDWVSVVIGHELAHLVFDTATANPYRPPPHWLNEGLATWLTEEFSNDDRRRVATAIERGSLLPLRVLANGFPGDRQELFYLGYAEGASAVDFFIRTYGTEKLVELVRSYADGRTDDEAFRAATGADFAAFEAAWLADLGTEPPVALGPQPACPGRTPEAWVGEAGGPSCATEAPVPGQLPGEASGDEDLTGGLVILAGLGIGVVAVVLIVIGRRRSRPGIAATAGVTAAEAGTPDIGSSSADASVAIAGSVANGWADSSRTVDAADAPSTSDHADPPPTIDLADQPPSDPRDGS